MSKNIRSHLTDRKPVASSTELPSWLSSDGISTGSCVGRGVWLRQEVESKEPFVFTINSSQLNTLGKISHRSSWHMKCNTKEAGYRHSQMGK